jgi:hypothetical protein
MIYTVLELLNDMLPLTTDVNVPTVRISKKIFLKATAKMSRSGSVSKCDGSGTLPIEGFILLG